MLDSRKYYRYIDRARSVAPNTRRADDFTSVRACSLAFRVDFAADTTRGMQSNTILRSDVGSTEKLMGNNNNLNNNGSPGADIMFQMEDEGLTQLGSVFQSAYQSIVGGGPQVVCC